MNPPQKQSKIRAERMRQSIPNKGACFDADRTTVDGLPVGYMFRDEPDKPPFSGWTFMAGDESQELAE